VCAWIFASACCRAGRLWGSAMEQGPCDRLPTIRESRACAGPPKSQGFTPTPLAGGQYEHGEPSSPKPPQAREVAAVLCSVDSTNRFARPRIGDKELFAGGSTCGALNHRSKRIARPLRGPRLLLGFWRRAARPTTATGAEISLTRP